QARFFALASAVAIGMTAFCAAISPPLRQRPLTLSGVLLKNAVYAVGAVTVANVFLDRAAPTAWVLALDDKYTAGNSKNTTRYFIAHYLDDPKDTEHIRVTSTWYAEKNVGDVLC